MSENEKIKRRKIKPFVGKADTEEPATKPMPEKPETKPEEYELFKKLDEIKEAVEAKERGIIHQLCRIADALENKSPQIKKVPELVPTKTQIVPKEKPLMRESTTTEVNPPESESPEEEKGKPTNSSIVKQLFTKELEDLLGFTEDNGYVKVKPLKYLGSDNFAKIAGVIRNAGGEYMSAGRDSHFRIPISSL